MRITTALAVGAITAVCFSTAAFFIGSGIRWLFDQLITKGLPDHTAAFMVWAGGTIMLGAGIAWLAAGRAEDITKEHHWAYVITFPSPLGTRTMTIMSEDPDLSRGDVLTGAGIKAATAWDELLDAPSATIHGPFPIMLG